LTGTSIFINNVNMTYFAPTFNNLALGVCLASLDDFTGCGVQLKAVRFAAVTSHLAHLNVLKRDYTFWFFVL